MEEIRVSPNTNFSQIDDFIKKLDDMQENRNFTEYQETIEALKHKTEQMSYNDWKYFLKRLIPVLIKVYRIILKTPLLDEKFSKTKHITLDMLSKPVWDNDMIDLYHQVVKFLAELLKTEMEEMGLKAMKIFLDYYKNMKSVLGWEPIKDFLEFSMEIYKNFEHIVNDSFLSVSKDTCAIAANKSLKIAIEIPFVIIVTFNLYQEQITPIIQAHIPIISSVLKVLKPLPPNIDESSKQNLIYSDYLTALTKLVYLIVFLVKINENLFDPTFKKYSEDIIKTVMFIFDNLSKDNIHTRREILSVTKNLIKPFANVFCTYKDYFKNEENLLGKASSMSSELVVNEANKLIFTLIDNIHNFLTVDDKLTLLEDSVMKINKFSHGYELKFYVFYYIFSILESLRNANNEPAVRVRMIIINNGILRELALFFETLWKILSEMSDYFSHEKREKVDFLDRNFCEMDQEPSKPDMAFISTSNINRVYDILLNNEYEKFVNTEETKNLGDLFKHSNTLLKFCVSLIHLEMSPNVIGINQLTSSHLLGRDASKSFTFPWAPQEKKTQYLCKIFKSYILICERIFKNHSHISSDEGSGKLNEITLVNTFLSLPSPLCYSVFQNSMDFIYQAILNNSKLCPNKNCLLSIFIDTIFDTTNLNLPTDGIQVRKELFDIFLDYFINKIHYIGNNLKTYENYEFNSISMTILINIFKSLFKYLNFVMDEKTKQKITNFLVTCLLLTKNSKFFGNYIYVVRCLFKSLLNNVSSAPQGSQGQFEFYKETIHLVYGMMKFMINIKEDFPFLKEMLTEIIMIFPIKFKYMIDYAKIVFPSLIDALNMTTEIIPVGLQYLEQWMNALFHKPENVNPFLQNNINLLTTLLTSHLYKNYAISLNSLKLLSKFGGKSRNYMEDKMINPKTSPTNILVIDLCQNLEKNSESPQIIEFPIDNIVDLCIKIVTNYKRHLEKNWLAQIKTSFKTLKACFLSFIDEEIDPTYLHTVIDSLRKGKGLNPKDYDTIGYFKKIHFQEEQIKINIIYRKAEHFLVEKLLRGLFLCCTITEIEEDIKDFVKFICDYFVLIMLSKDQNNKFINVFEIDPTIILDIICEFLFSNNPTVFKNNNQTCISIAIKLINNIIDTLEQIFDKNWEVIEKLEIVDILFMKLLNSCYNYEWSKKGGGIVTLLILIKRFSQAIVYKYLSHIIRAVFLVTNNYLSSTVKIKYESDCEAIIQEIVSLFILKESDSRKIYQNLLYLQEEIFENVDSMSMYSRKIAKVTYQLLMKNKKLKHTPGLFIFIDKLTCDEFCNYYDRNFEDNLNILEEKGMVIENEQEDNIEKIIMREKMDESIKYTSKFKKLISKLSSKLDLDSSNFLPMLANSEALIFLFEIRTELVTEFLIDNFSSFLDMIKNLINILATDMFLYLEITKKIHEIQFVSKFKYFFLEKFYSTKQLCLNLSIKLSEGVTRDLENEIPEDLMPEVMKYIFQVHHNHIFEQYTQANASFSNIDPQLSSIFPILNNKMNMMKSFIKFLTAVASHKLLNLKIKEKKEKLQISKEEYDKFNDLKNKSTNLIFRFIIYREEKILLKVSKKYIQSLLELETSTRYLLPDEELKKCIKPVLEQVAQNKIISFKLAESLAILLKLLSSNFNETLGKRLKEGIDTFLSSNDTSNLDNTFVHCIISLFSHLQTNQIKDFPCLLDIVYKLEKETFNRGKSSSIFNSKYKNKFIKLLTKFSEEVLKYYLNSNLQNQTDSSVYIFFKRLLTEDSAYVLRETFAIYLQKDVLPQILDFEKSKKFELKQVLHYLSLLRLFKQIVKKAPGLINLNIPNVHTLKILKEFLNKASADLYSNPERLEVDKIIDEKLKFISVIFINYYKSFDKNVEFTFSLFFYNTKTKQNIIKEKIKLFMLKAEWDDATIKLIMLHFLNSLPEMVKNGYLNEVLKYMINPLLIKYIRLKTYDHNFEKIFVFKYTKQILSEEYGKLFDDKSTFEVVNSIILVLVFFLNPRRESILKSEESQFLSDIIEAYLRKKYSQSNHTISLYAYMGLSFFYFIFNKQGDKMFRSLNSVFFRQNQYDQLNIINLCFDTIVTMCMNKLEDSAFVCNNLRLFLTDRSVNINALFNFFSVVLRYHEFFYPQRMIFSNMIISFILKSMPHYNSATSQHKKMTIALFGLLIYWCKQIKPLDSGCLSGSNISIGPQGLSLNPSSSGSIDKLRENTLILLLKYFRTFITNVNDQESNEISKKYLLHMRELCKISSFHLDKFMNLQDNERSSGVRNLSPLFFYSLKIAICYSKKDSILSCLNSFVNLIKQINLDYSINIRSTNEVILVVRSILNEKILNKINTNLEAISNDVRMRFDSGVLTSIKDFLEHHENNLQNKKRSKNLPEIDFGFVNEIELKKPEELKEFLHSVKTQTHNFSHEKLLDFFPHFEFRYFTMFYFYIKDNKSVLVERYPNNFQVENLSRYSEYLFKLYFETWYIFTIIILQVLREEENEIKKKVFENPDCDYFTLNMNFFSNLNTDEIFDKIKTDKSFKLLHAEKKQTTVIEMMIESILIGYYNVFQNDQIMSEYKSNMSFSFLLFYQVLHGTPVQSILELLINLNLNCPQIPKTESNKFILSLLKNYDYSNKKIPQSLLGIIIDYLEGFNAEKDRNLKEIMKVMMFSSRFSEYALRKRIFKLYEKFYGRGLMSKMEWIFQIDTKSPDVDNISWLPYSVDFLLHHFQVKKKIKRKPYSSKLKKLHSGQEEGDRMVVDEQKEIISNSNTLEDALPWLNHFNKEIRELYSKTLLIPIRDIVLGDITISQKMWFSIFPQVWKVLSKDDQDILGIIIKDFLIFFTTISSSGKGASIVKAMLESLANCRPLIRLDPEVLFILAKNHNSWNSVSFYLERMLTANIERERCFICLNKIFEILKEDDHNIGLKRFSTNNKLSLIGLAYLQCTNFYKAEEIFYEAFRSYREISINPNLNIQHVQSIQHLSNMHVELEGNLTKQLPDIDMMLEQEIEEFPCKIDFSIWEQGLIESYKNTNKWTDLLLFSEDKNDIELKIEAMWHLGKWREIDQLNLNKHHYLAKINQIYMMMSNREVIRMDNSYQQRCMECIRSIFSDFLTYPQNFEKLNYFYYLIFQMIVEAWESTNTLKEIEKNIQERKPSDFRENLIMWRDRIPHICEGFYSLKSILDPRNYLFDILKEIVKPGSLPSNNFFPNISDHVWNNLMFIRHARKLKLDEVYVEYSEKFTKEIQGQENLYPIETFLRNIEHLKIFRGYKKNFEKGYQLCEELLKNFSINQNNLNSSVADNEIKASYLGNFGFFAYKVGKVQQASEAFKEAVSLNGTDYHLWKDWGQMSDWVLNTFGHEESIPAQEWFNNAICNYLTTIVFKLDKSKYLMPRIFYLLKKFHKFSLKDKFTKQIENIPTWVWIFWLPQIFNLIYSDTHRNFAENILKKVAFAYPQYIYYPLSILLSENKDDSTKVFKNIEQFIRENDVPYNRISKIDLIITLLNEKMNRSQDEFILSKLYINNENVEDLEAMVKNLKNNLLNTDKGKKAYLISILDDILKFIMEKNYTIFTLNEKLKNWRNFIHSKLASESNFNELSHILKSKLYNTNFDEIEIPGFFVNKLYEPTNDSKVYITRFESDYSFKFINFSQKKLLIRGSNEKLYNFSLIFERYNENSENKIHQLQTILNATFTNNKDTYKSNVKFLLPIKYQITNLLKIVQEEPNQYYMSEVYEFCLQKLGWDPEVATKIYEEEFSLLKGNSMPDYGSKDVLQRVYTRMQELLPKHSFKSFIHKFIINCDEIFIFRKQFAASLAVNNFLANVLKFQHNMTLSKISFNKDTGSTTLHDFKFMSYFDYSLDQICAVPFRLSRNLTYFLSPSLVYGIIPGSIRAAANAICEKQSEIKDLIFTTIYCSENEQGLTDEKKLFEFYENYAQSITQNIINVNENESEPMRNIMDLIRLSVDEENLSKMPVPWNPWF